MQIERGHGKSHPFAHQPCHAEPMRNGPRSTVARAQRTPAMRIGARLGHAVNGLLNVTIGALALGIAGVGAASDANPGEAFAGLARAPGGQLLIWVIVAGMLALGLWQFASAVSERDPDRKRRWLTRLALIGKGVAYIVLAAIAIGAAIRGASGGGGSEEGATAQALASPGGVVLVVLAGLIALGVGGYLVVKGVRRGFLDDLKLPAGTLGAAITVLGILGYVARGIAIGVVGILFITAAVTADAAKAGGLGDALAALAALPFGQGLLVGIGLGFIAYGAYSLARARFARL
jgi:hypothetical protein